MRLLFNESAEFMRGFAFNPPTGLIPEEKVVGGVHWLLEASAFVEVFQGKRRRLIPHLQHIIVMFSMEQKGQLNPRAFRLDDTLHLFRGIANRHISSTSAWTATWRR